LRVEVRLYGALRRFRPADLDGAPHNPFGFALPLGGTVETLAAALGIPDGFVSAAAVNDEAVENIAPLRDGDRVSLFPPSAGGGAIVHPGLFQRH
jgi:molybdopterin converting factor small subunit